MVGKRTFGGQIAYAAIILIMIVLMIVTVYPFLHVLFASLSDPVEVMRTRGVILAPLGDITFAAYKAVMDNPMVLIGYRNTLFYVVTATALNVLMTILGAYALSRKNFMLKTPILFMIIFTMWFHGGLIPRYLLVSQTLGLQDNPLSLIVPGMISTINLIILRTAFEGVPPALEEAARMDGANDFQILWKVMLPMCIPTLAVIILFYAVHHWNAWFDAMLFIRNREWYPLQIVLREILVTNSTESMTTGAAAGDVMPIGETIKYAIIIVATVPILFIYPFLQKYFVKGVMIGAIKE
ncbi:MAG: carbohydrate ABC transporter permease [Anaerolineales bacterium]|nr:carbohydrate ABC transporter permease [Anaerolineales bacterium]